MRKVVCSYRTYKDERNIKMDTIKVYEKQIHLNPTQVKEFVRLASACDFDVDIFYNRYEVDAKSILGVYALDLRKAVTVRMHGYNEQLDAFLNTCTLAS